MGTPISGDDGDRNTISDPLEEGVPEEGDSDVEDRVSESAIQVIETIADTGIPEATPSEGTNSDLNSDLIDKVEYEAHGNLLTTMLARIRKVVSQLWKNTKTANHPESTSDSLGHTSRELLQATRLPKETSDPPYFHPLESALASCRSFFYHVFLRLFSIVLQEESEAPLDLCGTDPISPEAAVAFALILRSCYKWVAIDAVAEGLPLEIIEEKGIYNALSLEATTTVEEISKRLSELLYSDKRIDGLANVRGITKIISSPYLGGGQCLSAVHNLESYDLSCNYAQMIACATQIDAFADKGKNEALIMKDILYLVRQDRSKELGDFLMTWAEEHSAEVNYDVVLAILEVNLAILEEDYHLRPLEYQKKLNYVICQFFCSERLISIEPKV
ncbi:hypothetical protein C10C_0641 [Chlamydia serpentis]|uniref:Uncharacterized protein n=1 Tax=Chlamydia serpentis TaxID=1967782 RepID=A0A2R8FBJ2_9CHLA|nr:hypothetical protein [Chlamydia serpentis]SPN73795.1 hypothetical protein C10C_0641 [Chlamydia serpentis]